MVRYTIKRFISMIITLWMIVTITFFLMHAVPGDPFQLDQETPQIVRENLEEKFGLNKTIGEQYIIYLKNICKGNFGESMIYKGQTVTDKVKNGLPASAMIGLGGITIGCLIGVIFGIIAALNRGRGFDYFIIILAIVGVSIPSFVFGSLLQYVFSVKLRILPVAGWGRLKFFILPVFAAALQNIAYFARMLRTNMLDVIGQDYVYTAISKGLTSKEVVCRHVLRNSSLPLVTALGPMIAGVFMGSFVIEKIFNIPGLGQHFIVAIQNTDYMMIMGLTVFFSTVTIVMTFIVDLLYGVLDPRIKIDG